VEVALAVHVGECLEGLEGDVADLEVGELALFLQQLEDVAVQVLEHKVQLVVLLYQLEELHDVRVVQLAQDPHFIQVHTLVPISVLLFHPFDGY
jgi:hypothetical protein